MSYRRVVALALCAAATLATHGQFACAQRVAANAYRKPLPRPMTSAKGRMHPANYAQEMPAMGERSRIAPSQPMPQAEMHSNPFSDDGGPMLGYGPASECCDDYCGEGACDGDYCGTCDSGCCGNCGSCGPCGAPSQWFFTADYLYVRSSFSDSIGYVDVNQGTETHRDIAQLEFDYESSFRFGGGYRMSGCGDEIRFLYTRLESSAFLQQDGGSGIFAPYYGNIDSDEELVVHADAEINSYDLEFSKAIPLGGGGCACGGCGGCCGSCSPWEVAVFSGFRAAEAEWNRAFVVLEDNGEEDGTAAQTMDFDGAGLKVGLEGRRYFFGGGWLSMYAKGALSLLYGDLDFNSSIDGGQQLSRQSTNINQIIPVTDLEAGMTAQISCYSRMTAGYLMSAWHDLGFREHDSVASEVLFDDANILGFDGFFARLEFAY
jgi:hypothetical protein